jgi:hypothetical protein
MAAMSRELIETGLGWRYTPPRMAALITDSETVALVVCDASRIHGKRGPDTLLTSATDQMSRT